MRHWKIWLYLIGMTAILISCILVRNPDMSDPLFQDTASQPAAPTAVTVSIVQDTPTVEPSVTPSQEPTPTEVVASDQCVECHTNQDRLIETARVVVEEVEESEGAG